MVTSLVIAATVEVLRRRNLYRNLGTTVLCGLILAVVAAIVSAPVTAILFGGVTASFSDLLTAFFRRTGRTLLQSVVLSGLSSEPVDKVLVSTVAFLSLKGLPERFLQNFNLRGISDK